MFSHSVHEMPDGVAHATLCSTLGYCAYDDLRHMMFMVWQLPQQQCLMGFLKLCGVLVSIATGIQEVVVPLSDSLSGFDFV